MLQRISPSASPDIRFLGGEPGAIKKGKGCGLLELFNDVISALRKLFASLFSSSSQSLSGRVTDRPEGSTRHIEKVSNRALKAPSLDTAMRNVLINQKKIWNIQVTRKSFIGDTGKKTDSYQLALAIMKGDSNMIYAKLQILHPYKQPHELKEIATAILKIKNKIGQEDKELLKRCQNDDYAVLKFASKCIDRVLNPTREDEKMLSEDESSIVKTENLSQTESVSSDTESSTEEDLLPTENASPKTESTKKQAEFRPSELLKIMEQLQEKGDPIRPSDLPSIRAASVQTQLNPTQNSSPAKSTIVDYVGEFFNTQLGQWHQIIKEKGEGVPEGLRSKILNNSFARVLAETFVEGEGKEIQQALKVMIQDGKRSVDDRSDKELEMAVKQFLRFREENIGEIKKEHGPNLKGESLSAVAIAAILVSKFLRTVSYNHTSQPT